MESLKFLMISTHFPPYHLGGDAVYVEYLAKELVRLGHEVHVLHNPSVYGVVRKNRAPQEDKGIHDGIHRHIFRHRLARFETLNSLVLGIDGRANAHAAETVHEVGPDVVHWHNTRGFIGVPTIFGGETSIYTSHDYGSICPRSNLLRPDLRICEQARLCTVCCTRWRKPPQLWRAGSKRVLRLPEDMKVIAPSEFLANRLKSDGVEVAHVLRNFVPDPCPGGFVGERRDDVVVYLGMLEIHKGLRTLVRAFENSLQDQGFALDIIGDGSLREEVNRMAARSNASDRLHVHGFLGRDEAERLRGRAAAQIVPSEWFENCPLTILEAFASGVPVVGSEIGGIPEIVGPESGSRLFRPWDVDGLAKVLVDMWSERDEISSARTMARRTYESRFGSDAHMKGYIEIVTD